MIIRQSLFIQSTLADDQANVIYPFSTSARQNNVAFWCRWDGELNVLAAQSFDGIQRDKTFFAYQ